MADIFVRRSTGCLLFTIAVLSIGVLALVVLLFTEPPDPPVVETIKPKPIKFTQSPVPVHRWEREYRIPSETLPIHYDLYLHPDLETGRFNGRVSIQVSVNSPMDFLVTHCKYLNISKTALKSLDKNSMVDLNEFFEYKPNQFWVLIPQKKLAVGNYSMELEFSGSMEDKLKGFYKSTYTNGAGEKRSIATSMFQPTDARAAFPCFDEPSLKSTFTVTLVRPSQDYIALSNMPVENEVSNSPSGGLTEVVFEKSVPMVTYLACFIVCDFDYLETRTQDNKLFRVYATKEQIHRAKYSMDIGVNISNYFENYFEMKYPLPKQDMIAIPDLGGAMEHWGLITYRESLLLFDDEGSSSKNKQGVAIIVSHELAHMWFGNLVTLKWWDDLWLNEGFASYIEYKGVAQYEKDWDVMDQFIIVDLQPVLELDAKLSSHPIVQPVAHPDQISEMFDKISYGKGASVLRMLDNFMGEEPFRLAVRNFLREFEFDNAVTSDLWKHFEKTSTENLPIGSIMDTWTKQMGFPVINVKKFGPNKVRLTQERFLADPTAISPDDSPYGYKWDVPITFMTDVSGREQKWFFRDDESIEITLPDGYSWAKFNVGQFGYYRVNYDSEMWDQIIKLMNENHETLNPADRSSLLDDAFSLAAGDELSFTVPFRLASYLHKETHYIPWKTVSSHLTTMLRILPTTKAYPHFQKYVLSLVEEHANRVGWTDTGSHLDRRLRPLILSMACLAGSRSCISGAKRRLEEWIADPNAKAGPNLRSLVYQYGMKTSDYAQWQTLLTRYSEEINAQEKTRMLLGLTSPTTRWIVHRFLDESRNSSIVRKQDYIKGLIYASRNPSYLNTVWNFVKSNWKYLVTRFTLNSRSLGTMVKVVISEFTTPYQLQDVEAFFASQPEAGAGKRARDQGLEALRKNIDWLNRNSDILYNWLIKNTY